MRPIPNRLRHALFAVSGAALFLALFAHPFFAVTRPSGGRVLVAEGWMHHAGLRAAARLFREGGYTHLYLTGTVRPFAYYLEPGGAVEVRLAEDGAESISLSVNGLPGARWALLADGDTLLRGTAGGGTATHRVRLHGRRTNHLRFASLSVGTAPASTATLLLRDLRIDGRHAHALARRITVEKADGRVREGRATHAEEARDFLRGEGLPDSLMTAVPSMAQRRRTRSSALAFAEVARRDRIGACDVATLGVHAHRTWKRFTQAMGAEADVGIIALPDPWCPRWTWWTRVYGWRQVLKEVAALPSTWSTALASAKAGTPDEHGETARRP